MVIVVREARIGNGNEVKNEDVDKERHEDLGMDEKDDGLDKVEDVFFVEELPLVPVRLDHLGSSQPRQGGSRRW